jgi:ribosomal protein S18 acetylase RimI-like enzyme
MTQASGNDSRQVGILWMLKLDETRGALPVPPAPLVPATFQSIGSEAALALSQAMGHSDPTEVLQRLARGKRCYAACVEGQIASYGWVTFDEERIGELGLSIRMQAGEAYIWDCATLPAYRGLRLYPALLVYMLKELRAKGLQRIWIGTDLDNVASQKGVILVGFQPVIDVGITYKQGTPSLWVRARAGVSEQDAVDARHALFDF